MTRPAPTSSSSPQVMQTLAWMRKQGFRPVALHPRSKAAISRSYVDPDYKPPADDFWQHNDHGVGVVTGPAHSGPIDVDLDCDEAIFFARVFLPPTDAVFGRDSKKASHYLYRVEAPSFDKRAFNDPKDESTIIEARGDQGHQTVMPGSLHEATSELIRWESVPFPDVPTVAPDLLIRAVRKVAIATLIARHIWSDGYHNEPCKHLTGLFYYLDWSQEEVELLITAVMNFTGDTDKSRLPTVRSTYKRAAAGKKVSGAGVLRKQLNDNKLVDRLLEWAGSPTINLMQEYNERFAVVSIGGKFRIAGTDVAPGRPPVFYGKDDWLDIVGTDYTEIDGKPVKKGKLWLANPRRRSYHDVDFLPGQEETDVLNLWTGWAVKPEDGSCDAWIELVRDIVCGGDETLFDWLCHWFANILREPMNKSMTAPVFVGVEGAGKSLMLNYFGAILGPAYLVVTKEQHITGQFNHHLGNVLLLHSEEALYGGDKKHAGIIRSLITDPWQMFEQKGVDAKKVRNYLRLALTSNDNYAAPAKPGDRRYTVFDMADRKAPDNLIKAVLEEMHGGGPAALHHALLEMKYDETIPRTNVKNTSLLALKTINLSPIENWWLDVLASGMVLPDMLNWATRPAKDDWPVTVSSVALHTAMMLKLKERNVRSIPSEATLAIALHKFIGIQLQRSQREYDNPLLDDWPPMVKNMNARQNSIINMPALADCRKNFEKYLGQTLLWPSEDKEVKLPRAEHDKY